MRVSQKVRLWLVKHTPSSLKILAAQVFVGFLRGMSDTGNCFKSTLCNTLKSMSL